MKISKMTHVEMKDFSGKTNEPKTESLVKYLQSRISDGSSLEDIVNAFEDILIALKVGPTDKEVIKDMSWNTILLICGVSILMNVVVLTGGIDLMVAGLSSLMTEKTAAPIMGLTAGIMSWFSTTTSVVMPTLIPTIPGILEKLGGDVNVMQMLSSVVNTSFAAAVSPLSAGGGIVLATYVQLTSCKEEEQSKWFKNLFLIAILCVVLMVIVDALGIYIHI